MGDLHSGVVGQGPQKLGRRPQFRLHGYPTKSSWLWLGEGAGEGGPCDLSCSFCFYKNATQYAFNDAESLLCRANKYRFYYGLSATDVSGGEPTIYHDPALAKRGLKHKRDDGRNEHLEYLIRHCANIGLAPSIISHGANYTETSIKALEDAGVDTFEMSLHGLGRIGDRVLGHGHRLTVVGHGDKEVEGHFEKMVHNARFVKRPLRWNTTVVGQTYKDLPGWARFLVAEFPPTVANMITWMSYDTWGPDNVPEWMENYPTYAPYIAEAVGILEGGGYECNVRYFPLCLARKWGFAANTHQHFQIQYDPWEWAFEATADKELMHPYGDVERGKITEEGFWRQAVSIRTKICDAYARQRQPLSPPCQSCAARNICEGQDSLYTTVFGTDHLTPIRSEDVGLPEGAVLADVNHFLRVGDDVSLRKQEVGDDVSLGKQVERV